MVVGGIPDVDSWDLRPDPETAAAILARATALVPGLRGAEVLAHRVGLRPARPAVRLEAVPHPDGESGGVVHCYGHGGAGVTLSWGCADDRCWSPSRELLESVTPVAAQPRREDRQTTATTTTHATPPPTQAAVAPKASAARTRAQVTQPRPTRHHDDEHALQPAAHLVRREGLQDRLPVDAGDQVGRPGDRQQHHHQPQGLRQPGHRDRGSPGGDRDQEREPLTAHPADPAGEQPADRRCSRRCRSARVTADGETYDSSCRFSRSRPRTHSNRREPTRSRRRSSTVSQSECRSATRRSRPEEARMLSEQTGEPPLDALESVAGHAELLDAICGRARDSPRRKA